MATGANIQDSLTNATPQGSNQNPTGVNVEHGNPATSRPDPSFSTNLRAGSRAQPSQRETSHPPASGLHTIRAGRVEKHRTNGTLKKPGVPKWVSKFFSRGRTRKTSLQSAPSSGESVTNDERPCEAHSAESQSLTLLEKIRAWGEGVGRKTQSREQSQQSVLESIVPSDGDVDIIGEDGEDQAEAEIETNDAFVDDPQSWRAEQLDLNQLLKARNEFSFLPSTWKMSLRGIPFPDGLFYVKTRSRSVRPRIYAHQAKNEYRGIKVLRNLIDVHGRVRDLRTAQAAVRRRGDLDQQQKQATDTDLVDSMVKMIKRVMDEALDWAHVDGGFARYGDQLPRNIKIIELQDEGGQHDTLIQAEMLELAQTWRDKISTLQNSGQEQICGNDQNQSQKTETEKETTAGQTKDPVPNESSVRAPVVFGFVMYRHTFLIVTLDAADPDAVCNIPISLNLEEQNQHQWNALAIMVTLCWARDLLERVAQNLDLEEVAVSDSSDPDA